MTTTNDHSVTVRIPATHYRLYELLSRLNGMAIADVIATAAEHGIQDLIGQTVPALDSGPGQSPQPSMATADLGGKLS